MDLATKKIHKAIRYLEMALKRLEEGNKRMTVYYLDHSKENSQESVYLLLDEIKQEQNN